ncbi:hypothetical protein, partial [Klebsiella pneumoniae]|uniref:hypothetical protein n=1 Tax=Klebsiella pneumoniae TaxID=573 RepID=UPI00374668FD
MNKVLFICVVYATQPEKTITLNSLANIKFEKNNIIASFAIWDNSQEGYESEAVKTMLKNHQVDVYHYGLQPYFTQSPTQHELSSLHNPALISL